MQRFYTKKSKKSGMEPGTTVHVGEQKIQFSEITLIDFTQTQYEQRIITDTQELIPYKNLDTVTWINVDGLADTQLIEDIGKIFALHPLTIEDIASTGQRPKIEDYGDYIYIVLKSFYCDDKTVGLDAEQISLVLGSNYVISFQERHTIILDPIKERIKLEAGRIRKRGADYLLYSLIDTIVDNYFLVLEESGERIEKLESALISSPDKNTLNNIYNEKREIMFLRKSTWPLRELCNSLEREESNLIDKTTKVYLRDVYDHTFQIIDTIETFRDILSNMLDIYLSSISNKMNEIMKLLTIISTIFIPLTFIVGLYGMNFEYMPELHWKLSYPIVLFVMTVIAVLMLVYFKRKKWL